MLASVNAKHTRLGSGGCYALVNVTTQIAKKMLMPTDRHQVRLKELEAVVMLSFACRTIITKLWLWLTNSQATRMGQVECQARSCFAAVP